MRIIFMGTPAFAVPALHKLMNIQSHEIIAVFTQAPKPYGRGMKVQLSPVHKVAQEYNLPIYTPKTLRSKEVQNLIIELNADLIVVVAYGFIIPANILTSPRYGCINIHPSDLPKYRGPAPLPYTILAGERDSAVCLIKMDEGVDTGPILLRESFNMPISITYTQLHDYTAEFGAQLLAKAFAIGIDKLSQTPQSIDNISYTAKISKIDGKINWQQSAQVIERQIRALNPWPGIYFEHEGLQLRILAATYDMSQHTYAPGTILFVSSSNLAIACGEGMLYPQVLQRSGKQALTLLNFLQGYTFSPNTVLS